MQRPHMCTLLPKLHRCTHQLTFSLTHVTPTELRCAGDGPPGDSYHHKQYVCFHCVHISGMCTHCHATKGVARELLETSRRIYIVRRQAAGASSGRGVSQCLQCKTVPMVPNALRSMRAQASIADVQGCVRKGSSNASMKGGRAPRNTCGHSLCYPCFLPAPRPTVTTLGAEILPGRLWSITRTPLPFHESKMSARPRCSFLPSVSSTE